MIQTPLPPAAPLPDAPPIAADPNFIFGRVQETVGIIIVAIILAVVAVKVLGPLARAWARRIEGRTADPELRAEVDQLRDQLAEVDSLRVRVHELEERLEFAERLLTERRDQDALPRGGRP